MKLKLIALAMVLLLAGCASQHNFINGIPNLHLVRAGIWRGGQPTTNGWIYLHDVLHVTNVVKLNTESEGSDAMAEQLGMVVNKHPVNILQQLITGPHPADFAAAVACIVPGTFVHCGSDSRTASWLDKELNTQGGQDRTGLAIGCLRFKDGWSAKAAYDEMRYYGFHPMLHGLHEYWEQWAK